MPRDPVLCRLDAVDAVRLGFVHEVNSLDLERNV